MQRGHRGQLDPAAACRLRGRCHPGIRADRTALLTLLLTILEVGLVLFGQAALDTATADAARLIRTGQVQQATAGQSLFTSRLCGDLGNIVACGSVASTGFVPGGPGQFVVVQVSYQPNTFVPLVGPLLRAAFGSLLVSTVTFQNEAY